MLTILLGIVMAVLDNSAFNLVLPNIAEQTNVTTASVVFVTTIYQASMVLSLLPLSALGDRVGYKNIFVLGIIVFVLSSLACAVTSSFNALIVARYFQGIAGGALAGVNIAIIRSLYPDTRFSRAIGVSALIVALTFCIAPWIASACLTLGSWRLIFIPNLLLGPLILAFSIAFIPNDTLKGLNTNGYLQLFKKGSILLVFTLPLAIPRGAQDPTNVAITCTLAFLIGLLLILKHSYLILKRLPDSARKQQFVSATIITLLAYASQSAILVSLPFFFYVNNNTLSPIAAQAIFFWALSSGAFAFAAGHLTDGTNGRSPLFAGLLLMLIGMGLLACFDLKEDNWQAPLYSAVAGAGFGLFQTHNVKLLLSFSPVRRSGRSNGVLATTRLIGQMAGGLMTAAFLALDPDSGARLTMIAGASGVLLAFTVAAATKTSSVIRAMPNARLKR